MKGTAASALWDTMERAARSVSEQMSGTITAQGQGLSEGQIKYEGRLIGKSVLMLLLMLVIRQVIATKTLKQFCLEGTS